MLLRVYLSSGYEGSFEVVVLLVSVFENVEAKLNLLTRIVGSATCNTAEDVPSV